MLIGYSPARQAFQPPSRAYTFSCPASVRRSAPRELVASSRQAQLSTIGGPFGISLRRWGSSSIGTRKAPTKAAKLETVPKLPGLVMSMADCYLVRRCCQRVAFDRSGSPDKRGRDARSHQDGLPPNYQASDSIILGQGSPVKQPSCAWPS